MKYSQERTCSAFGELSRAAELRPKQVVLAKLAPPHQRTVRDVAAEEGISPATLYHWRQQARRSGGLFPDVGADPEVFGLSSAEGWTARDKFTASNDGLAGIASTRKPPTLRSSAMSRACPTRSFISRALSQKLALSPTYSKRPCHALNCDGLIR